MHAHEIDWTSSTTTVDEQGNKLTAHRCACGASRTDIHRQDGTTLIGAIWIEPSRGSKPDGAA